MIGNITCINPRLGKNVKVSGPSCVYSGALSDGSDPTFNGPIKSRCLGQWIILASLGLGLDISFRPWMDACSKCQAHLIRSPSGWSLVPSHLDLLGSFFVTLTGFTKING